MNVIKLLSTDLIITQDYIKYTFIKYTVKLLYSGQPQRTKKYVTIEGYPLLRKPLPSENLR